MGNMINRMFSVDGPLCRHKQETSVDTRLVWDFLTRSTSIQFLFTVASTWFWGTVLFVREIPLTMEPFYGQTWALRQDGLDWIDYIYRIPASWSYIYNFAVAEQFGARYHKMNSSLSQPTPPIEESHSALVRLMLASPMVWRIQPIESEDVPVRLRILVNTHEVPTLPAFKYSTKTLDFRLTDPSELYKPSSWTIEVESSDTSLTRQEQLADAVGSILFKLPIGWHSWVHFPYGDFSSGWVLKCQIEGRTDGPLFRIMRQHTMSTKWNTTGVHTSSISAHTSADFVDTTTNHQDRKSSVMSAFPTTQDSFLGTIMGDVHANQKWLVHPLFQYMMDTPSSWLHTHPILKVYFRAYTIQRQFVDTIHEEIQCEAIDFARYVYTNSGCQLDHRDNSLALVVRVLLSAGFIHAIDHNLTAVSSLDVLDTFNPVMRASINKAYYDDASETEKRTIDANVDFNQKVRFPNFVRTFVDHTHHAQEPTMTSVDYGTNNEVVFGATTAYKVGLQECVDELNSVYIVMGLDRHLTDDRLLASKLPISINH